MSSFIHTSRVQNAECLATPSVDDDGASAPLPVRQTKARGASFSSRTRTGLHHAL